jgi:ABC-type antimicrobial peptide transport system permease subunit
MLGLIAGGLGAITGGLLVAWMGVVGIPAGADILVFLFAGPRLHPTVGIDNLALGVISVLCVALISAAYPAILASRVQPVVAMQGKE